MKLRLTRIAGKLGYKATPEHVPTHADVLVHDVSFCLGSTQPDPVPPAHQGA
jgi:hypothetical protein